MGDSLLRGGCSLQVGDHYRCRRPPEFVKPLYMISQNGIHARTFRNDKGLYLIELSMWTVKPNAKESVK